MRIGIFKQLKLLLWKNFLRNVRRSKFCLVEMAVPILLFLCICGLKSLAAPKYHEASYPSVPILFNIYPKLSGERSLLYTPCRSVLGSLLMRGLANNLPLGQGLLKCFDSEHEMDAYAAGRYGVAGIVFSSDEQMVSEGLSYTIKMPSNPHCTQHTPVFPGRKCTNQDRDWGLETAYTGSLFDPGPSAEKLNQNNYYLSGFIYLQNHLNKIYFSLVTQRPFDSLFTLESQLFPYMEYKSYVYARVGIIFIVPIMVMLSYFYPVICLVSEIVKEKEDGVKELLQIMGLKECVYWLAWFLESFFVFVIRAGFIGATMLIFNIAPRTSHFYLLALLAAYAIATICFCFFLSTLFKSAKIAASLSGIFFFASFIPFFFQLKSIDSMSLLEVSLRCLSVNLCMSYGFTVIGEYEQLDFKLGPRQLLSPVLKDTQFSIGVIFIMLAIDAILYLILTSYISQIHPGHYGLAKPWHFPVSYPLCFLWKTVLIGSCYKNDRNSTSNFGSDNINRIKKNVQGQGLTNLVETKLSKNDTSNKENVFGVNESSSRRENLTSNADEECFTPDTAMFEKLEPDLYETSIEFRHISKRFPNALEKAIDGLSVKLFKNQVTTLLGQNGAGKTTFVSILTGLCEPSKGKIFVHGFQLDKEMGKCRESLGVCCQTNTLFRHFTVKEHLVFFALLKGIPEPLLKDEVAETLVRFNLESKEHVRPEDLSGGNKRKLCMAMAFIGESSVIVLDEPCAGMDPCARKKAWDIIHSFKKERTILLTTHYLNEADALSDRVIILNKGKLCAVGSPHDLKKSYGQVHLLTIRKNQPSDTKKILKLILDSLPDAEFVSDTAKETIFRLSDACLVSENQLLMALKHIEVCSAMFGIDAFGITRSSLEEVFFRLTSLNNPPLMSASLTSMQPEQQTPVPLMTDNCFEADEDARSERSTSSGKKLLRPSKTISTKSKSIMYQIFACLYKRYLYATRDAKMFVLQLIIPIIFIALAMVVGIVVERKSLIHSQGKTMSLSPEIYFEPPQKPGFDFLRSNHEIKLKVPISIERSTVRIDQEIPYAPVLDIHELMQELGQTNTTGVNGGGGKIDYFLVNKTKNAYLLDFLLDLQRKDKQDFLKSTLVSFAFRQVSPEQPILVTLLVNTKSDHALPIFLNEFYNAALHTSFKDKLTEPPAFDKRKNPDLYKLLFPKTPKISARLGTFNRNASKETIKDLFTDNTAFYIAFMALFGISFLASSYMPFLVEERESGARHIQFMSGLSPLVYWISNFIWDFTCHGLVCGAMMLLIYLFRLSCFTDGRNLLYTLMCFLGYGWAMIPALYIVERCFRFPITAYTITLVAGLVSGIGTTTMVDMLRKIGFLQESQMLTDKYFKIANYLYYCFYWLPNFAFGIGIIDLNMNWKYKAICKDFVMTTSKMLTQVSGDLGQLVNLLSGENGGTSNRDGSDFFGDLEVTKALGADASELFKTSAVSMLSDPTICETNKVNEIYGQLFGRKFMNNYYYLQEKNLSLAPPGIGRSLISLLLLGMFYFGVLLMIEYKVYRWISWIRFFDKDRQIKRMQSQLQERQQIGVVDDDHEVKHERQRVLGGEAQQTDFLVLKDVTKVYHLGMKARQVLAVDRLSVGLPMGECFGLLGLNGNGKSTIFKMITGEQAPDRGEILIGNKSIRLNTNAVHGDMGYCPQTNPLIPKLTGRETLYLIGMLRGIVPEQLKLDVDLMIGLLELDKVADKECRLYSGGNKRRLVAGMAMLGGPRLILLDEMSCGVDVVTRRFLWALVNELTDAGHLFVMTSHSMAEIEATCTKIGIIHEGRLIAHSSVSGLKARVGGGDCLYFSLKYGCRRMAFIGNMMEKITGEIPRSTLAEQSLGMLVFKAERLAYSWTALFEKVKRLATETGAEEYSVYPCTLDHVFVDMLNKRA